MSRELLKSLVPPIVLEARRRLRGLPQAPVTTGYLDAAATVAAAKAAGVSICELRERQPNGPGRPGRRDGIMRRLADLGVFVEAQHALEIGPGTGMFLESTLALAAPKTYEFYEVSDGWSAFLVDEYRTAIGTALARRSADGWTLSETADGVCDLVQAHAVFVYIPLLNTVSYLRECARVTRPGGYVVFDCFFETSLSTVDQVAGWESSGHLFPVVAPRALIEALAEAFGFDAVANFSEPYAGGRSDYVVWRKRA